MNAKEILQAEKMIELLHPLKHKHTEAVLRPVFATPWIFKNSRTTVEMGSWSKIAQIKRFESKYKKAIIEEES